MQAFSSLLQPQSSHFRTPKPRKRSKTRVSESTCANTSRPNRSVEIERHGSPIKKHQREVASGRSGCMACARTHRVAPGHWHGPRCLARNFSFRGFSQEGGGVLSIRMRIWSLEREVASQRPVCGDASITSDSFCEETTSSF